MPQGNDAVKVVETALDLGFSLPEAIQRALGRTLADWGAERGFRPSEISMCFHGYTGRVLPRLRDAAAEDLGVPRATVDAWIERWAKQRAA